MATDVSRTRHQALLIPEADISVWDDESSYTEASPAAGIPQPTSSTQLALSASGDQTTDYRVRVQYPGLPRSTESGARIIRRDESGSVWFGYDPPRAPSSLQFLFHNDADIVSIDDHLDVTTTETETVVAVAYLRDNGLAASYRLEALVRSPVTGAWSRVVIDSSASALTPDPAACIVYLPKGRLQVYQLRTGVLHQHLRMWYSDDDGSTWSYGGDAAVSLANVTQMRVAYSDGQLLLVVRTSASNTAYASSDDGHTWEIVGGLDNTAHSRIDVVPRPAGGFAIFCIGRTATNGLDALLVGDAYQDPADATVVSIETAMTVDEDFSACLTGEGHIQLYRRDGQYVTAHMSTDGGATWPEYYSAASTSIQDVLYFGSSSSYPSTFACTPVQGRVALLALHTSSGSATTPSGTLLAAYLMGGWTSQSMVSADFAAIDQDSVGWTQVWYPVEQPDTYSGWTRATTGTPTRAFEEASYKLTSTSVNHERYTSGALNGNNVGVRCVIKTTGGSLAGDECAIRASQSNCEVKVRFSSTGYRVVDGAGTQVGSDVSVSLSSGYYQVWVEVDQASRAVVVWHRAYDHGESRSWNQGVSGTLSATSPASSVVEWGNLAAPGTTLTAWWGELIFADGNARPVAKALNTVNPTDLRGRLISGAPYIGGDVRLTARHGPAYRGEEWTITARPHYRIENLIEPSPRRPWRATGTAQEVIAFRWDAAAPTPGDSTVLGIMLRSSNIPSVTVEGYNGSSWTTIASGVDLTLGAMSFARTGSAVKPGSVGVSPLLHHAEYAGSTFGLSSTVARRIKRHREGHWDSTSALLPIMRLEGVVDGSDPASGAGATIIPDQVVILVELAADYEGLRLTIPSSGSSRVPAEDYWTIGSVVIGWVHPIGYVPSWGRTIVTEYPTEMVETRDRQTRTVSTAPAQRRVALRWVDGIDQTVAESSTADEPDYVALDDDAGAYPAATAYTLEGLMREVHGNKGEVVYLQNVPVLTGTDVLVRRYEALHGRPQAADSSLVIETVQGEEGVSEVARVTEWTVTEIV